MQFPKTVANLRRLITHHPNSSLVLFLSFLSFFSLFLPSFPSFSFFSFYTVFSFNSVMHVFLHYNPPASPAHHPLSPLLDSLSIFSPVLHTSSPWRSLLSEIPGFCLRGRTSDIFWLRQTVQRRRDICMFWAAKQFCT